MIYVLVPFVGNNLISSKKFLPTAALWSISFDSQAVVNVYYYTYNLQQVNFRNSCAQLVFFYVTMVILCSKINNNYLVI